jgi:hypothetical protein
MLPFMATVAHSTTWLYQEDFDDGTVIIDESGTYKLAENISFNPNNADQLGVDAYEASFPLPHQFQPIGIYDRRAFSLGFFTAIMVTAKDVEIDLNGKKIEQSKEHALLQRFFSLIELADQPFVPNQGPANFGEGIKSAQKVIIRNGVLGRTSHHGIHGNGNKDVLIEDVTFRDYEVAAIALNGPRKVEIKNVVIEESRTDVPVLGTFSSAQFIKQYINFLVQENSPTKLMVNGTPLSATDIQSALKNAIIKVYNDLIIDNSLEITGPTTMAYRLFHNPSRVVDGNAYGVLINKFGVAVDGFPYREGMLAKEIKIINTTVKNHVANINEVVALANEDGDVVKDPAGAVFQALNRDSVGGLITVSPSGQYIGNPVANAQAFVYKAFENGEFEGSGLDLSRMSFDQDILDWVESQPGAGPLDYEPDPNKLNGLGNGFLCNGDSMFHVNKGVIGMRLDAAKNINVSDSSVMGITNLGKAGSDICGPYVKSHTGATLEGYGGAVVRGINIAGAAKVTISNTSVEDLTSESGTAIGFDVQTNSKKVELKDTWVYDATAGAALTELPPPPTARPDATAYKISSESKKVLIDKYCGEELNAPWGEDATLVDESGKVDAINECES